MESDSIIYESPSFSRDSSNNIADIADRVVQQLRIENGLHDNDEFNFSDDQIPVNISEAKSSTCSDITKENDELEFEFPVVCRDSDHLSPVVTVDDVITDDQISPKYPFFDRTLLLDVDSCSGKEVNTSEIVPEPDPAPVQNPTRLSLAKLFSEDRDSPSSTSSSESDDLEGVTPGTYCVWKPEIQPQPKPQPQPRGKHKKSNSISIATGNTSKRWKVRDLLKRSYSDDSYSKGDKVSSATMFSPPISPTETYSEKDSPTIVFSPAPSPKPKTYSTSGKDSPVAVFSPPISPKPKPNNQKVKKTERTASHVNKKTENKIPAYKTKIGNIRLPPYLPYREDQLAAFANFTGSNRNQFRF